VEGKRRVEAVWIAEVDERMRPIAGTEVRYPCDTLLLSVGLLPENELSREAGVELSPVTRGPVVNESLETSIPGVFACGNVLHVHDLVDYVSEEAATAGASAARFVQGAVDADDAQRIPIVATDGVRYTVPSTVSVERMPEALTVRFRVGNVYRDHYVSVYLGDDRIQHRKKRVMAPGEMEQVILLKSKLAEYPDLKDITIKIEEA
jgi:pyruvate/2-oxoglutarate dehydrogenase complex dihydrolipoamide dehydrogenase (E3) component